MLTVIAKKLNSTNFISYSIAKFIEVYEKVLELREREASKRSLEQTECRIPTGLVFCTNVNYASATDPATEQYFISLLNETFSGKQNHR